MRRQTQKPRSAKSLQGFGVSAAAMPVGAAHGNDEPRWSTACGSTSLRSVAVAMETNGHVLQTGEARALRLLEQKP